MSDFTMDWPRKDRTGVAEAVFCAHKSAGQIAAIIAAAHGRGLLFTRLPPALLAELPAESCDQLDYDTESQTAFLGTPPPRQPTGIGIVCAGTSDLPVAREAQRTLHLSGHEAPLIADVGVAGLWRLQAKIDEIAQFRVCIAVAGMEGALFSVLAGLLRAPVIAVPVSVGYGVAAGGQAALTSALASCSPGVVTVNIDNGFGAAAAAIKIVSA